MASTSAQESAQANASKARAPGSMRGASRRAFVVLVVGGLVGAVAVLPYALALNPPRLAPVGPPLVLLLIASVAQTGVLVAGAAALGLWLGPRVGLGAPLLVNWLSGEPAAAPRLRAMVVPSALAGIVTGAAVLLLDVFVFAPRLPSEVGAGGAQTTTPTWWYGLLASLYGGLDEEILLRLGLMTLLVWLGARLTGAPRPPGAVYWTSNVLGAILFGLGHLPATAALVPVTPLVVARALALNGIAGIVFGWLYWRQGLLAAIVAHFAADLILHVIAPILGTGR
jgi:Type II CAAX prenyl endopeptidase Rce1-like